MSTATLQVSALNVTWDAYWSYSGMPELGGIYSDSVRIETPDGYIFDVQFRVGDHRVLGILFVKVTVTDPNGYCDHRHYSLGQFYTNAGAIKFSKFALGNFIETEKWDVCPSFQYVDYIDGEPFTLAGDEIVSEIS
jgi:hypothetical protein